MTERFPIYLTNTRGHRLEEFTPQNPDEVHVYTCGPTVYNYQHIGNFRAFLFADTLRRVLEYNGYPVRHVRNITDVGHLTNDTLGTGVDKMEAAARRENLTPQAIADHFTEIFHRDQAALNIQEPTAEPRATEFIPQMVALTERLIERGYGYPIGGDVYYEVARFPPYGSLSGNTVEDLIAGARVEVGEGKRSPADFALWKEAAPDKLMRYESPWGPGVPGWHLECSAMALDLLGDTLDIHTGGEDHVFPHHEDEIAQSEGATGRPFARYWLHNAFLQLAGAEKMSKSVGNILTISDLAERGIYPLSYRYFTYQAHYRTPLNFTWEALEAAQTALYRIYEQVADLLQTADLERLSPPAQAIADEFHRAVNNDLALPEAVALVNTTLGGKLPAGEKLSLLADFDRVLALDLLATGRALARVTPEEAATLERRAAARAARDWTLSDALRAGLAAGGVDVRDTADGQRWVRRDVLPRVEQPESGAGD